MKSIQVSQDIFPLANFKIEASRILKEMKESNRPVVITLNGRAAGVVVTPNEYDRLMENQKFLSSVKSGLSDISEGRTFSEEELDQELEDFGL